MSIWFALRLAALTYRYARRVSWGNLVRDAEMMQCCNPGIDCAIQALLDERMGR